MNLKQIYLLATRIRPLLFALPRAHKFVLLFLLGAVTAIAFTPDDTNSIATPTEFVQLPPEQASIEPDIQIEEESLTETALTVFPPIPDNYLELKMARAIDTKIFQIKSGDTLSGIFSKAALPQSLINKVARTTHGKALNKLYPGETFEFSINKSGELEKLQYIHSTLQRHVFTLADGKYQSELVQFEPDIMHTFRKAVINDSLFMATVNAGVPEKLTMELVNIFGWDIDFVLDIRKGDYVNFLYEELYLDGELIGSGNIIAAEFFNNGKLLEAVRYTDADGDVSYYSPEGKPMKKAFLRTPLNFSRISSNFNPNRLHPVTGSVRPHRGTDYAAPVGTPVYAAGNGKVVKATYDQYSGNYVVIQHGKEYQTKYLHLSKRKVKVGEKVKQGQTIGLVGATGRVTGAHLHYEFLVNGVHRNPRTVKLPQAQPIKSSEQQRFFAQITPVMESLASFKESNQQYASIAVEDNQG